MRTILVRPVLTEKSYKLAQKFNQYTFEVALGADKLKVAAEVASKFNVEVTEVKMLNQLGKVKRFGARRKPGRRSDTKKAIVTLKSKQSIDLFEIK